MGFSVKLGLLLTHSVSARLKDRVRIAVENKSYSLIDNANRLLPGSLDNRDTSSDNFIGRHAEHTLCPEQRFSVQHLT